MKNKKILCISSYLLVAFAAWTVLLTLVDVKAVGPLGSKVGFATINHAFHRFTGVNMTLYTITEWAGLIPIAVAAGFAVFGLIQFIKRKSIFKVDKDIVLLGVFYAIVVATFVFFEIFAVNYRPILIEGILEASYPSSTTMLTLCVMPTAIMQFNSRIKVCALRRVTAIVMVAFTVFTVIGRLISGVHWLTDIIGGALFSSGLVTLYSFLK